MMDEEVNDEPEQAEENVEEQVSEQPGEETAEPVTEEETADALGVSTRTVRRDWVSARAWILAEGRFADETTLDP